MSGFFSKLFGGKKKEPSTHPEGHAAGNCVEIVREVMDGLLDRTQLDLNLEIRTESNGEGELIRVELTGPDEASLLEKEGALLDSFQLFVKRVLQHRLPDARVNVDFDCNNFREEANKSLVDLAEKLKEKAIEQGRSVYLRALAPKDRKVVHQYLASDERVRSRSVGDGLFKKIKIYPVRVSDREQSDDGADHDDNLTEPV